MCGGGEAVGVVAGRSSGDVPPRVVSVATLLLLRHGRTTANADGGLAGRQPVELDDTGRAQATAVGGRLAGLPLAAVVTSPLIRCRQTLELALPGTEPVVDEGLIECGYGDWEGQSLKKLAKEPLWPVVQQHPSAAAFPRGSRWRRCPRARWPRYGRGTRGSPPSTGRRRSGSRAAMVM